MPYGRLRENRKNRKRADIILISKTPEEITESAIKEITSEVKSCPGQKIYFTRICYDALSPVFESEKSNIFSGKDYKDYGAVLITGIAAPGMLNIHLKKQFKEIIHLDFPDHHYFDENDIQKVKKAYNLLKSKERLVITTEKDAVRLRELSNIEDPLRSVFCYLPVRVSFINDYKTEFDNLIFEYVRKDLRNNRIPQG
jgi:tetraacyldisaccharide 4'-kinase